MRCHEVQSRLVAWQDGELSPGENTQVTEHLARCGACVALEGALARATPAPCLRPDPAGEAELWGRLDAAIAEELSRPPTAAPLRASTLSAMGDWLREETRVPTGAVLAYAALLLLAVAWGATNWLHATELSAAVVAARAPVQAPVTEIPAESFLPASWSPPSGDTGAEWGMAQPSPDAAPVASPAGLAADDEP